MKTGGYWQGNPHLPPGMLSLRAAAVYLDMDYNTLYRWVRQGKLHTTVYAEGPAGNQYKAVTITTLLNLKLTPHWRRFVHQRKKRLAKLTAPPAEEANEHWEELTRAYKDDAKDLSRRRKAI